MVRSSVNIISWLLGVSLLLSTAVSAADCPPVDTASIHAIKGHVSPQIPQGERVTVEGVVSGAFLGRERLNGFFLQQPAHPANPLPAGLFVYAPRLDEDTAGKITPGNQVQVAGRAELFRGQVQLSQLEIIRQCGTVALPEPVALTLPADPEELARLEGLYVRLPQTLTVTGNYPLGRYGSLKLSADGRLYRPTNAPGIDAGDNARRRILLDDGSYRARPRPIPYLDEQHTRRAGSTVRDLTGVLAYAFDDYRIHPTEAPAFHNANPRPARPPPPGGRWRVAAFNVENYFITLGRRGAQDWHELQRQRSKLLAAVHDLEADVLAVVEVENDRRALLDLVAHMNREAPPGVRYQAVEGPDYTGDDAIKVALVYRADRLETVGPARSDAHPVHSRPPVAAVFRPAGDDADPFGVVAMHFKSKTGCPEQGDVDRGQGCWNRLRVAQAEALRDFLSDFAQESGVDAVLVAGDLNAYGIEDPVQVLRAAGLGDLIAAHLPPERRYTYVFRGEAGYLDHALATPALARRVRGVSIWHINADEPPFLAFDGEPTLFAPDPYRSSDHDPVLVGLE